MLTFLLPSYIITLIGMIFAAVMGFAIQRGATCMVAAVEEWVTTRRVTKLRSMIEASLWVLGGLLAVHQFHLTASTPPGFSLTIYTLLGATLLGVGAYVNRACVFGAIARFGCGEWSFLMTPLGFYLGCCVFRLLFIMPPNLPLKESSILFRYSPWIGGIVFLWALYRIVNSLFAQANPGLSGTIKRIGIIDNLKQALTQRVWSPGAATIVIGMTFLCMFTLIGPWAYTDLLSDLSFNMAHHLVFRSMLLLALLAGAILGGWSAGRLQRGTIELVQCLRSLTGGAMMGIGSLMIPGGNDSLLLIGLPLLWPYAWAAFATMCFFIALCMNVRKLIEA